MNIHAYLFELRSIQPFLFSTGKLRDMVAGSELIDYLCGDPLKVALEACGLKGADAPSLSPRCAGGAFYLLLDDREKANRFRQIWTIMVAQLLPGIEQVDALCSAKSAREAIKNGLEQLRTARNIQQVDLPTASPLALRSQRTGEVAVSWDRMEALDASTSIKRRFKRPESSRPLTSRFCAQDNCFWPDNFEADAEPHRRFPLKDNNLVGLVHADGNGLGEILRIISDATQSASDEVYVHIYRTFSDGLDAATCKAAQHACQEVLLPERNEHGVVPARPLVLGGDDLTLIVRADLALPFTEAFTREFELSSAAFLKELTLTMQECRLSGEDIIKIPAKLTACAGVTYMKASQPFSQCYELTESLCSRAKSASRQARLDVSQPITSSLAFHRLQGNLIADADSLFMQEMTVHTRDKDSTTLTLGLPVYGLDDNGNLPALHQLYNLTKCFSSGQLNDKRLRSLATLLHADVSLAIKDYQRWRTLANKAAPASKEALKRFDDALDALLGRTSHELPADVNHRLSPLVDLLALLSIHRPSAEVIQHD